MSVPYKTSNGDGDSHDYPHKAANGTEELKRLISNLSRDNFSPKVIEDLILNKRADPNVRDGQGWTLLLKIVMMGKDTIRCVFRDRLLRTFAFLLECPNVNVNIRLRGSVLLIHVVLMRDPRFLSLFLERRPDAREGINLPSDPLRGKTPLHFACADTIVPLQNIRRLLAYGANPNAKCAQYGRTPLQYLMLEYGGGEDGQIKKLIAILGEFFRCPATRLGDPNLCDKEGKTLLHYAVGYVSSSRVLDMLLERGEHKNILVQDNYGKSPMELAKSLGKVSAVKAMSAWLP